MRKAVKASQSHTSSHTYHAGADQILVEFVSTTLPRAVDVESGVWPDILALMRRIWPIQPGSGEVESAFSTAGAYSKRQLGMTPEMLHQRTYLYFHSELIPDAIPRLSRKTQLATPPDALKASPEEQAALDDLSDDMRQEFELLREKEAILAFEKAADRLAEDMARKDAEVVNDSEVAEEEEESQEDRTPEQNPRTFG